jgi:hypothetical protein
MSKRAAVRLVRDPETRGEWQDAVDAAHALLAVDAAKQYGLVTGGPTVNVERCTDVLRRGALMGIQPNADAIWRLLSEMA